MIIVVECLYVHFAPALMISPHAFIPRNLPALTRITWPSSYGAVTIFNSRILSFLHDVL